MKGGWAGMTQAGENSNALSNLEKDMLPLNVLLHCRTVVEGKNTLTTGVMTNVEGELFEVEIHEFEQFELGETVKLTIYSPAGIQSMHSVVFAKYEGAIALLQPPELNKRFKDRREHPRVNITGIAHIIHVLKDTGEELALDKLNEFEIQDISISGISFSGQDTPHLFTKSRLKAKIEIGIGFSCELEIVRRERHEDVLHWGATMQVLEPEMLRPLRALILRQQVEIHAEMRRESNQKRIFKE
jgi:hypothetical protein